MPKYVLLFIGNEEAAREFSEAELARLYEVTAQWFRDQAAKGILRGAEELKPAGMAKTVRRKGYRPDGQLLITDGPFIEAKEQVGGYAVLEVPDMAAALEAAKAWPNGGTVEVREVVDH